MKQRLSDRVILLTLVLCPLYPPMSQEFSLPSHPGESRGVHWSGEAM
jgi:hypothetical protein